MAIVEELEDIAELFQGTMGIAGKNLTSGEVYDLNGDQLFPTASVFKIPVLVEMYRQVERGEIDLDEEIILRDIDKVPGSGILREMSEGLTISIKDLASLMMIVSDNTATDLILHKVGKDEVNGTLEELGFEQTRIVVGCREILFDLVGLSGIPEEEKTLENYMFQAEQGEIEGSWSLGVEDNNVTTPREMAHLLELIVKGEAASRESCDSILEIMGRCQTGRYRIPKYLPSKEIQLVHKTGSLPGIRNDSGVITIKSSGERYILSCFTKDAVDVYEAEEAIAEASLRVYEYFA
jgi:beta-lactamase class A